MALGLSAVVVLGGNRVARIGISVTGGFMNLQSRIESLKLRHANLENRIADEDHRPRPDDGALARLKLAKLQLKDEMERLRGAPVRA